MKFINLPFKYRLMIYRWCIALDYVPNGTDKENPLLMMKRIWAIPLPGGKPKDVL